MQTTKRLKYHLVQIDKTISMLTTDMAYYQYTNDRYVVSTLSKAYDKVVELRTQTQDQIMDIND